MKKRFYSRRFILLWVALFAALVWGGMFLLYLESPFRFFHKIPGLDMETLLRFSEWGAGKEFSPLFVVHRFIIYLVWLLNGREHCVPAVVLIQCLCGAAGAVLTADLVLMLWRRRIIALLAGVFYSLYSVFLLYDLCILQESVTTFLILLSVWAFVRCRSRRFPSKGTFLTGVLLGLSSVGRPVAALLSVTLSVKTFFEKKRKASYLLGAGVLSLWLAASVFNFVFSESFFPFFKAVNYTLAHHAQQTAPEEKQAAVRSALPRGTERFVLELPRRAAQFFLVHEVPENLNFYFLRNRIFPLKYLPGPGVLMPFALAGIFLMLLRIRHRESLLLWVIVLLALPLAARESIGRYRLYLVPYFILAAAYFAVVLEKNTKKTNLLCGGALALALAVNFTFSAPAFIRSSDHVAWGRAVEIKNNGRPSRDSLKEFYLGWVMSRHTDRASAVNLITSSLRARDVKLAVRTCREGIEGPAKEKSIYHYYLAVLYASARNFCSAEKELRQVRGEEIPALRKKIQILHEVVRRKSF